MRDWRKFACAGQCGLIDYGDRMHAFESGTGSSKRTVHYCRACCPRCAPLEAQSGT